MPKGSSAKYYRNDQEILQKMLSKDIKVVLRQKRTKSNNMVAKYTKIYGKMKKLVEYRKQSYKIRKNALLQL